MNSNASIFFNLFSRKNMNAKIPAVIVNKLNRKPLARFNKMPIATRKHGIGFMNNKIGLAVFSKFHLDCAARFYKAYTPHKRVNIAGVSIPIINFILAIVKMQPLQPRRVFFNLDTRVLLCQSNYRHQKK